MGYYSESELSDFGFKSIGTNVKISKKTSFYNCSNITIGNNVRIDDFCIISAGEFGVYFGNNIHMGVYSSIIGAGKVIVHDFANISSKVSIYSSNDDYSGNYMTNPTIPVEYTNVRHDSVVIQKHVIVGSGCVILPGVTLSEGAAIGALSLVNDDCEAFYIYAGTPIKRIKKRERGLLDLEREMIIKGDG
ncbi:putative lipopolysaccharide biosynthesis O-acetyl transferase WbbJ [Serratia plymuthica]|nr:putative lipopolysaccharide biosynthesis O-acetyl transferase WbbJ [Serratia plymuthica]